MATTKTTQKGHTSKEKGNMRSSQKDIKDNELKKNNK
jgi:hypothetical protein